MDAVEERTGLETLPEEECWRLLQAGQIARLAVVVGTRPDIFPVNYLVEGRSLLIRTAPGTKLAAAVLNGHVALEIDHTEDATRSGWSVVVHGTATEVDDLPALLAAEATGLQPWARALKNRWLHIDVDAVSGRRVPGDPIQP